MNTSETTTDYDPGIQAFFAIGASLLLTLIIGLSLILSFESHHKRLIYPGVSMDGIDLSGQTIGQAATTISQELTYPTQGKILFTYGDSKWLYQPEDLGYSINPYTSADKAYKLGRGGSFLKNLSAQLQATKNGVQIGPIVLYDQRQAYQVLQEIAAQIDTPMREASVRVDGTTIVVTAGQTGRKLDITASLEYLDRLLMNRQDGAVPLVVRETEPLVMDADSAAQVARSILSDPLVLKMPNKESKLGPWTIEIADLAKLLVFERPNESESIAYNVSLNQTAIRNYLENLAEAIKREPENARFIFNDDTRLLEVIKPGISGRALNVDESLDKITSALADGDHDVSLVIDQVEPVVKDDTTGESLGITELVVAETSYFYGSADSRLQNIIAASSSFHGLLIPPGETFSMASQLTDISLENGYAEALIIVGGETVKGVGGGVCQVSSTLFRTAFFGGYPIVERHAHAYRVGYYEQEANGWSNPDLAGMDATVYFPLVDLKFTNDTPYWLLMETYVEGYSLTWKFYSTKDDRMVEWNTTGVTDIQPPLEPLYRENPELSKGTIIQVDWAVEGASVEVNRTVYKDGGVYLSDVFRTDYAPWRDIFEYGPGTKIPE